MSVGTATLTTKRMMARIFAATIGKMCVLVGVRGQNVVHNPTVCARILSHPPERMFSNSSWKQAEENHLS
jgi:hypothetical protein